MDRRRPRPLNEGFAALTNSKKTVCVCVHAVRALTGQPVPMDLYVPNKLLQVRHW